jgi:hypothetical protein
MLKANAVKKRIKTDLIIKMYCMLNYKKNTITLLCLLFLLTGNFVFAKTKTMCLSAEKDSLKNIFIKVVSSKKDIYVGEPFIVKYKLYTAVSVIDPQTNVVLKFGNCYQEEFPENREPTIEFIGGKSFSVIILKQFLVIAQTMGKLELPKLKINIKVNEKAVADFFDEERLITKTIYSNADFVTIKNLPLSPKPNLYTGAVGEFKISGGYTPSPKISNLLLFKLILDGIGNTKTTNFSMLKVSKGIDVYDSNSKKMDTLFQGGLQTHLEHTFQLVANYKGLYQIPPFEFLYFNPKLNKYVKYSSENYQWKVTVGKPAPMNSNASQNKISDSVFKDLDSSVGSLYSFSKRYFLLFGFGLMLYCYSCSPLFFNENMAKWAAKMDFNSPKKIALKNISALKKEVSAIDEEIFCIKAEAIVYDYIHKKSNGLHHLSNLTFETYFMNQKLPLSLKLKVVAFLNNQNRTRFGTIKKINPNRLESCQELFRIINELDKNWV